MIVINRMYGVLAFSLYSLMGVSPSAAAVLPMFLSPVKGIHQCLKRLLRILK